MSVKLEDTQLIKGLTRLVKNPDWKYFEEYMNNCFKDTHNSYMNSAHDFREAFKLIKKLQGLKEHTIDTSKRME